MTAGAIVFALLFGMLVGFLLGVPFARWANDGAVTTLPPELPATARDPYPARYVPQARKLAMVAFLRGYRAAAPTTTTPVLRGLAAETEVARAIEDVSASFGTLFGHAFAQGVRRMRTALGARTALETHILDAAALVALEHVPTTEDSDAELR